MPRPQKYSDSDIAEAIQSLVEEGGALNAMRVRMRLGGGNPNRIKAILHKTAVASSSAQQPEALSAEFQRLSAEASRQFIGLAEACWALARKEAAGSSQAENGHLRQRLERLTADLDASVALTGKVQAERDQVARALEKALKDHGSLERQCSDLKAALRNAESDLKVKQRAAEAVERSQRLDREQIRQLRQKVEELLAGAALVSASAPGPRNAQRASSGRKSRRSAE